MILQSNLDLWLATIVLFLAAIGTFRGFLKEITSILNWFGSLYLTSLAKPVAVNALRSKITTPFLLDIVSNAVLFVLSMIALSIFSNYLVVKIEEILPSSVNRTLGAIFGFIKGFLISMIVLASLRILYRGPDINKPNWLENSLAYNKYFDNSNSDSFVDALEIIFGDMIKEKKDDPKRQPPEADKKIENGEGIQDLEKDMNDLLDTIVD
jgi:membrane protein required for colicin V production